MNENNKIIQGDIIKANEAVLKESEFKAKTYAENVEKKLKSIY